jgi:uncharacterized membrane protein YphA (DoxX/SURF4 family)
VNGREKETITKETVERKTMKKIDRAILLLLAVVFLFSGIDKLLHYNGFVNALRSYILVPRGWATYLAVPLIAIELMIGIGLFVRPWRRQAALTAAITMAVFTSALGLNRLLGGRGICGCWFTITLAGGGAMHIVQNLIMLGLALALWWGWRAEEFAGKLAPSFQLQPNRS